MLPQSENQTQTTKSMSFRQFQLVQENKMNGRTGRVYYVLDSDNIIVSFPSGEELVEQAQQALKAKPETTQRMLVRGVLKKFRHSRNFTDIELIDDRLYKLAERTTEKHNRFQIFRKHLFHREP